jgi:hypothetical protein
VADSSILANWVQIQMGKTLKTINLDLKIIKFSHFVIIFFFKVLFLISNCTLVKDLIFWLYQLYVIINHMLSTYHHFVSHPKFENFEIPLCILLFKNSWSHSSEFVFHLFIQQLRLMAYQIIHCLCFETWILNYY